MAGVIRGNFRHRKRRDHFSERELPSSGTDRGGEDNSFGLGERRRRLAFFAGTFVLVTLMRAAFRRIVGALTATTLARNIPTGETKVCERAAAQRRTAQGRRRQPQHQQVSPHVSFLSTQRRDGVTSSSDNSYHRSSRGGRPASPAMVDERSWG